MLLISAGSLVYLPRRMPKLLKFPVKDCPSVEILIEYNGQFFLVIYSKLLNITLLVLSHFQQKAWTNLLVDG